MSSANPYDRSPYGSSYDSAAEASDDEPGSTQRFARPSFESESSRWPDAPATQDREEPVGRGYTQHAEKLSVLGPTVCFKGELTADEDLMIQGQVEGSIRHHARHLTIGPKGRVKADIHANHIIIQGEVEGDLYGTEAVIVETSSRVRGNIFAPTVALKEGARFKGSIDMDVAERAQATPAPSEPSPAESRSAESRTAESTKRKKSSSRDAVSDVEVNDLLE